MSSKSAAAVTMPDFTGRVINDGQFRLCEVLGSGAYGVVYRAVELVSSSSSSSTTSSSTTSDLAIKILRKKGMSKRTQRHVRREVTLHRAMSKYPGVVTMHDAFEDKDYVYIILDYCPGGDLFGKICEEKVYYRNDELVKKVFLQMVDAVHACHRKRVFHRDLKPENILVSEDGSEVYLSDFGLSTTNQISETFGCGSSYYMSPECIGKESGYLAYSNRASDVWSLGVILVNMVTCRSPWQKAVTKDECFCDFLLEENYLREMLPISKEANVLFRKIFTYEPFDRITLPDLRKAIVELDTFFMPDAEIARSGLAVRIAASYCEKPRPKSKKTKAAKVEVKKTSVVAQPAQPPVQTKKPTTTPVKTTDAFTIGTASSGDTWDSESSSAVESDGPITPATYPQDPEVAIPELDIKLQNLAVTVVKESKTARSLRVVNEWISTA